MNNFQIKMAHRHFHKVFTKTISTANITTAKSEEKRLEEDQYVPPPGHICFIKRKVCEGESGRASILTLGGVRMQESRTWKYASELFCRNLSWSSEGVVFEDLQRLKSFQVTTTKSRTATGSVTPPLFGSKFVDLEPEESDRFHLIIVFGEDVERFASNSLLIEVKGSVGDKIEADVTRWLPKKMDYSEFTVPEQWSDGSQFVQTGQVPVTRTGAQIGVLNQADLSATILCTGGVSKPSPGPIRINPEDTNIFLLKYPGMTWKMLPSHELLQRSHHSMHISGNSAFIIGGYSWSGNKARKLFPITEVTRIIFGDDLTVQLVDTIQLSSPATVPSFSPFLTGFAFSGLDKTVYLHGGIQFPDYKSDEENFHSFLPPEKPRNKLPDPTSLLVKMNLMEKSFIVYEGPAEAASHNSSLQILNSWEPIILMSCDPHIFVYRPV